MGPQGVFFDVEDIQPGLDFVDVLTNSVGGCDALVAVIGKRWMSSANENNLRRLDDPHDFVRIEIEAALERGVRVIPVLVDGAAMPKSKDLPDTLKKLSRKQGIEVSHTRFDSDVERLTRALSVIEKRLLKTAIPPETARTPHGLPKKTLAATLQNVGILTPTVELLFSTKGPGMGLVPKLQIGQSDTFFIGPAGPFGTLLFPALTEAQFKVESISGKVKVSARIVDDNSNLVVEIIRNEWRVAPPPQTWDRNYSDDALEVRDASGRIVLQVRALSDRIQLQGMWWVNLGPPNGVMRMTIWQGINPNNGAQMVLSPKNNVEPLPEISPIFVYPSELHAGELRAE